MTGLYNQSEKTNNIIFIVSFILYAFSAYAFSRFRFYPFEFLTFVHILKVMYFSAFLIFAPMIYGLFSQNLNKSRFFAILTALPFIWMASFGLILISMYPTWTFNFFTTVLIHLFTFVCFLILGYYAATAGALYHTKQGKIRFLFWKIPINSTVLIFLVILSGLFFFVGTFPFWLEVF